MTPMPFLTTVESSETSGSRASAKATQTRVLTTRSIAARRFSTTSDHAGSARP